MKRLLPTTLGLMLCIASLVGQTPQKDEWAEQTGKIYVPTMGRYHMYTMLLERSGESNYVIYRESNKLTRKIPSYSRIPEDFVPPEDEIVELEFFVSRQLHNYELLYRLAAKHLSPYLKDTGEELMLVVLDLAVQVKNPYPETRYALDARDSKDGKPIPTEVFERLDAEIAEGEIRVTVESAHKRVKDEPVYRDVPLDVEDRLKPYDSNNERQYYDKNPIVTSERLSEEQRQLPAKIISKAYERLWHKGKLRYFTPEVIRRVIVDVEYPEYRHPQIHYSYRSGQRSGLLLPQDKRARFNRTIRDSRLTGDGSGLFQICIKPNALADLEEEEDFELELLMRLVHVYVAYELRVEGRINPRVAEELARKNWFEGSFPKLFRYYAEVTGQGYEALKQTYIDELMEMLYPELIGVDIPAPISPRTRIAATLEEE
ncbi:MAG: hypothetical protein SPK09_08075 [Porphyromonas sp.]|nr:hypothetical protein [Porphyromonas sp.]